MSAPQPKSLQWATAQPSEALHKQHSFAGVRGGENARASRNLRPEREGSIRQGIDSLSDLVATTRNEIGPKQAHMARGRRAKPVGY